MMFSGFHQQAPVHICGLYYIDAFLGWQSGKRFLPQVKLEAKATILATTSQTVLTQTFVNPSNVKGIKECRYTFPLFDGVSVVGFTCHIGERKIVGQVKEREKARAVFQDAVARGETAGLLEQLPDASDVFSTTVGNIPPGAQVVIKITYLGELKHDMEVDGIRFTIPNIICPRYGDYPGTLCKSSATDAMGTSISITVDADMADGSFIQKVQSPTHPISMTMGTTSTAPNAEPKMTKASATLTLGTAELDKDFVLQVIAKNTGVPKAILETHPTISGHRALMATLVPKFALPPEKPEIVFVCDRSGSMGGTRIELAKQALKVFLKSLPVGVKFNICSFGWQHFFLWDKSATYNQQTLDEAMNHANIFTANLGGTEMLGPLKATIERRYKDMPLDIMLLTDGEDWRQQQLFSYLNEAILSTKAPIRIFTLGIGNGVSHAMIEGLAKAGNGFSQAVGEGEPMNTKVVRMLKGALSPHINDYTLEVKYNSDDISAHLDVEPDDDFEIVEKVTDSLKVKLDINEEKVAPEKTVSSKPIILANPATDDYQNKPISLFDPEADPDQEEQPEHDETGENRYAHLPKLHVPKIIQAPQNIPSLFAFHRTSVYLLLGPNAPQGTPTSVVLRGTSAHGPLELEIPIQVLEKPGETIHQLAAKKAISELEQGRGWLLEAKDESDTLIKTKFEGRYDDMVEREAVRLGVQFQVGGKWCSFVAIESNREEAEAQGKAAQGWEWLEDEFNIENATQEPATQFGGVPAPTQRTKSNSPRGFGASSGPFNFGNSNQQPAAVAFGAPSTNSGGLFGSTNTGSNNLSGAPGTSFFGAPSAGGLFGASNTTSTGFGGNNQSNGGLFGSVNPSGPSGNSNQSGGALFGAHNANIGGLFGSANPASASSFGKTSFFSAPSPSQGSVFGSSAQNQNNSGSSLFSGPSPPGGSLFGAPAPSPPGNKTLQDYQMGLMLLEQQNKKRLLFARQENDDTGSQPLPPAPPSAPAPVVDAALLAQYEKELNSSAAQMPLPLALRSEDFVHHLISLQSFAGSWSLTSDLLNSLELEEARVKAEMSQAEGDAALDETVLATALAIAIFQDYLSEWKGSWELIVEKGRSWLEGEVGAETAGKYLERARKVVEQSVLSEL
ncbi:uncharacterized protein yc1106_06055 [Curvularia clavata]|uniref:Uncharacterized protein n=1 Tax=Curvularia clavata TaxID=95742 RepID=A0A9Q8ZAQ2_CURCL|nr:uncharacterized protein yc1106_06055 [Curvularia clavata]